MIKHKFLMIFLVLAICAAAGCDSTATPVTDESSHIDSSIGVTPEPTVKPIAHQETEKPTIEPIDYPLIDESFISSKDDISLNLNFSVYAYSEGVWGDGAYSCICIYFNDFDVAYYEVELDGRIYSVIDGCLYLNEKYLNVVIKNLYIRAYDWNDNIIDESSYKNVMFFSPNISSELDDILYAKDELTHLWVAAPEYNSHDEFNSTLNMASLCEFVLLETLILSSNIEYTNLNASDIENLHRLHTLSLGVELSDFSFLTKLPYLTNLEIWLGEDYEYVNIGTIKSLEKFRIISSYIYKISLLDNFPNLKILYINSVSLQNLSNISDLDKLEELFLINTDNLLNESLKSVPPDLKKLIVYGTERPDYSFLKLFGNAEELRIINTDIIDLSFLEFYENLKVLDLNRSYSSLHYKENLDLIKGKTDLKTLILPIDYYNYCVVCNDGNNMEQENKLTTLSFLENLTKLEELVIDLQNVEDFSEMMQLDNLKELVLANISDISMFKGRLQNLNSLTLLNTSISDFSPLRNLKDLKKFNIYENYFYDASGYIDYDYPLDYSFLSELTKLKYIRLYNFNMYVQLKDDKLPDFRNLKELAVVELSSLMCSDISGLFNAPNIETILLIEFEVNNLNGIENLKNLNVLNLSWSPVGNEVLDMVRSAFGNDLIILQ
ncbi:MAG: hypothetical protein JXN65_10000 [Clostridia bacterium]|nr:hypothetical protein [Clostridia bacterium]